MNIFVLDLDPTRAAKFHKDKHVVKMVLETTQLLSTAIPYLEPTRIRPYKPTHINHPCSVWTRLCTGNYYWLWRLGQELCKEYTRRYDRTHLCERHINNLALNSPVTMMSPSFSQCMPDQYKCRSVVAAYRSYYMGEKRDIATWKTETPYWWK